MQITLIMLKFLVLLCNKYVAKKLRNKLYSF